MSVDPPLKAALTACYAVSITVSLFANSFVIAIVLRVPEMRTSSNLIFVHMAVADLLTTFTIMPRMVVFLQVGYGWATGAFGDVLCRLVMYTFHTSIAASVLALSFVACDRFFAIVWTVRHIRFFTRKKTVAFIIWFSSAILMCPAIVVFKNQKFSSNGKIIWVCTEDWPTLGRHSNRIFYICTFVFVYLVPLFLISVIYFLICRKLWFRQVPGYAIDRNQRVAQANKKSVVRMLIIIVGIFALCWLPVHVLHIVITFDAERLSSKSGEYIMYIFFWLSQANSSINPCLYICLNTRFRKHFKNMILMRSQTRSPGRRKSDHLKLVKMSDTKHKGVSVGTDNRRCSSSVKSLVHKN